MPTSAAQEQRPPAEAVDPGDRDEGREDVDGADRVERRLRLLLGGREAASAKISFA